MDWDWTYFLQEATELGKKARELKKAAEALHQEEKSGKKGRKWRKNVKALGKVSIAIQTFSLTHSEQTYLFEISVE